jgi:CheY-like chemotaxis protein
MALIIIVDDEKDIRYSVQSLFENNNYTVIGVKVFKNVLMR